MEHFIYRLGFFLANLFPLKLTYCLSKFFSTAQFLIAKKDRRAVINNIKQVQGDEKDAKRLALKMYHNFGLYLVDFFRFAIINHEYIKNNVEIIGKNYLEEALSKGNGVIALTAHLGNWELGGAVTALSGYKIAGVALPHKDKRVDDFFNRQRNVKGLEVIPVGIAVRKCFQCLKENRILALVGDRDFSVNNFGLGVKFFGKEAKLPKGPASLALKTGAAILPGFMLRKEGLKFKLVFDRPIYAEKTKEVDDKGIENLMKEYVPILERYIKENLTQWFMFREFWT